MKEISCGRYKISYSEFDVAGTCCGCCAMYNATKTKMSCTQIGVHTSYNFEKP